MAIRKAGLEAAAVRTTSRGPVLFRQERIGLGGRPFVMLKFRTMRVGADQTRHQRFVQDLITGDGPRNERLHKLVDDDRITAVGRILRRTSIDELPQLLNVLLGHMRVVGPRPAIQYEVDLYERWQRRRMEVKPGMTGLWQVSGRSRLTYHEMMRLDVRYVETSSFRQDVSILLRTIPALLRREAA